jgi:hypothetical protein
MQKPFLSMAPRFIRSNGVAFQAVTFVGNRNGQMQYKTLWPRVLFTVEDAQALGYDTASIVIRTAGARHETTGYEKTLHKPVKPIPFHQLTLLESERQEWNT